VRRVLDGEVNVRLVRRLTPVSGDRMSKQAVRLDEGYLGGLLRLVHRFGRKPLDKTGLAVFGR
jgi:hypothetical protein